MEEEFKIQMEPKEFQSSESVTILQFLHKFNSNYNANGIKEGPALWITSKYLNDPSEATPKISDAKRSPNLRKRHHLLPRYQETD